MVTRLTIMLNDGHYFLYYIQGSRTKSIKIGISEEPWKRLQQLQTASSEPLEMLGTVDCKTRDYAEYGEEQTHDLLRDSRLSGEWFDFTKEVVEHLITFPWYSDNYKGIKDMLDYTIKQNKKLQEEVKELQEKYNALLKTPCYLGA